MMGLIIKSHCSQSLDLTTPVLKGDDGGYYKPVITEDGQLSWLPSEEGMPAVEEANIRGPQGEPGKDGKDGLNGKDGLPGKDGAIGPIGPEGSQGPIGPAGESGVYRGTQEPTDPEIKVWLNPDGVAPEYATKEYVDNAIAGIANYNEVKF